MRFAVQGNKLLPKIGDPHVPADNHTLYDLTHAAARVALGKPVLRRLWDALFLDLLPEIQRRTAPPPPPVNAALAVPLGPVACRCLAAAHNVALLRHDIIQIMKDCPQVQANRDTESEVIGAIENLTDYLWGMAATAAVDEAAIAIAGSKGGPAR
jgi:hypothetical protein